MNGVPAKTLNLYRCTRQYFYRNPECPAHHNKGDRQGYYIEAYSEQEALFKMQYDHPGDMEWSKELGRVHPFFSEPFTVVLWQADVRREQ